MISVVIITLNEERHIGDCIRSALRLSEDVVVVDTGSTDATCQLARELGARVYLTGWKGFGQAKNFGAALAKHDWVFSLDADERITPSLAKNIQQVRFQNRDRVYTCKRDNYIGNRRIRFGTAGLDTVTRLYHRGRVRWDLTLVHEKLEGFHSKMKIRGQLLHYSIQNWQDYREKLTRYARLSAHKYLEKNKKASWIKRILAPFFDAFRSYCLELGFLDGRRGLRLAGLIAYYTRLKYDQLFLLEQEEKQTRKLLKSGSPWPLF
ncbi:MAG: glycosyltransferase family 2 protein [Flavisolibacter sp.]